MTSRELVKSSLEFHHKGRLARQMWTLPWAALNYPSELAKIQNDFPDDIASPSLYFKNPPTTMGDMYAEGSCIDEWGCEFVNVQAGIIGEVKKPLIQTWSDLEKVHPPTWTLDIDTDIINSFCKSTDKFVLSSCCMRPFERLQFLRGSENTYYDFAEYPNEIEEAIKIIHSFYLKEAELWAKNTDVDGISLMDDWGTQNNLLINPTEWRRLFKPLYKDYIDIAHAYGKKAFMHSDGNTISIIPDLIEIGLDAFNTQIFCIGVENLAQFKGQITFWGEIDRQHLLSFGSVDEVNEGVKSVYDNVYANGGLIAQCEFGAGAKPENVYAVYEQFNNLQQ